MSATEKPAFGLGDVVQTVRGEENLGRVGFVVEATFERGSPFARGWWYLVRFGSSELDGECYCPQDTLALADGAEVALRRAHRRDRLA